MPYSVVDLRRRAWGQKLRVVVAITAVIVAIWAAVIVSLADSRWSAIKNGEGDAANFAAAFQDEITHTLDAISGTMEIVARRMKETNGHFDIYQWAHEIPLIAAGTIQVSIIRPDGWLAASTLEPHFKPINLSDREHFRVHLDSRFKGMFISKPVTGRVSQQVTIQISRRMEDMNGKFIGVLVFSLPPSALTSLHKSVDFGALGNITLVGLDGVIRARFSHDSLDGLQDIGKAIPVNNDLADVPPGGEGSYIRDGNVDHVKRIYSFRRLANYPLIAIVGLDYEEELASFSSHARMVLSLAAIITLLLGGLGVYLAREIDMRAVHEVTLANERAKLRAANIELKASKEYAEAANQAKSMFLANMSHELRTPLNAIIGFSQVMAEEVMGPLGSPRYTGYARDICASAQHLLGIISDILDVSKLEAGKVELDEEEAEIPQIVRDVLQLVAERARALGIAIDTDIAPLLPRYRVDSLKLKQVLLNLITNAIKFSHPGGHVELSARSVKNGLEIVVADHGIGMDEMEIETAVTRFGQVASTWSRRHAGTGLGLPLAIGLVELHGGRLTIESVKDAGTTVRVFLPAERAVPSPAAATG